ncbi:pirin family protein [Pseudonocardia sp. WMMC193]|uniref:pirin family protein n=1 Tax=Pseudonocardia sp. WMMC193 TaxID=2911965 RepID=UPI001F34447E|nr:pirin family protein [Pseudonocardia sp. WMMC193]MCF7549968.1 pirin family protein [Pseudonocardia sp. WMMC193]
MTRMRVLRRGLERAVTVHEGCEARHGFSFGAHYDPDDVFFGALTAHNDERLAPGAGYPTHRHDEADLVTWVVEGELRHTDSLGNSHILRAGEAQVLAAGTGVEHAEFAAGAQRCRFVQSWLVPDALASPVLHTVDLRAALAGGRPVLVGAGSAPGPFAVTADPHAAAGADALSLQSRAGARDSAAGADPLSLQRDTGAADSAPRADPLSVQRETGARDSAAGADALSVQRGTGARDSAAGADALSVQRSAGTPLPLRRADAALWAARLPAGATWDLPPARFLHVFVARGSASLPAGELGEGDELRLTDEPAPTLTSGGAELLVWAMGSDLRP